jgi:hypothetical protein
MTDRLAAPVTRCTTQAAGPCPRCGRWVVVGALLVQLAGGAWACQPCALALAADTDTRKAVLRR